MKAVYGDSLVKVNVLLTERLPNKVNTRDLFSFLSPAVPRIGENIVTDEGEMAVWAVEWGFEGGRASVDVYVEDDGQ